eukprot:878956-Pyramimonas_sp.AAC.2
MNTSPSLGGRLAQLCKVVGDVMGRKTGFLVDMCDPTHNTTVLLALAFPTEYEIQLVLVRSGHPRLSLNPNVI